ncbi:organic solvent tolerance protein OstA [Alsobacter sp. SYSU M60028]|uniref:Organic solvent tolerance protein OstA n=1 Tax=Alsobacter ponti TaxID=2962936 RepID=A0ABT1LAV4_9HYPH|nr:LptA/OstA family protein [Alsobacter ponti]MCP8938602.1 organic solvent tolerance protein OstA [Alsobacter ponti]
MKRLVPLLVALLAVSPVAAQQKRGSGVPAFGPSSKAPIQIDADKLEVFSKDNKAVYSGNVVAVQGETTIKAATMTIFYDRNSETAAQPAGGGDAKPEGKSEGTTLRRVEAKGGVTVLSKDQVATGDEGVFDRGANKIILTGNVALSQGENVTKGERLVYDTDSGVAQIESSPRGGRVRGLFVTGDEEKKGKPAPAKPAAPPQKPKT